LSDKADRIAEVAKRDLERVAREGESLGGTAMDQASRNLTRNLANGEGEDHIDRLGKKIGRGIAYAILPFLIWYFGRTSGWW
jgi:hypothetical protein